MRNDLGTATAWKPPMLQHRDDVSASNLENSPSGVQHAEEEAPIADSRKKTNKMTVKT